MRILLVNRFFGGDQVPTGRMVRDVAVTLAEAGHEVTALTGPGNYANESTTLEQRSGVRLYQVLGWRSCGRTLAWVLYWIQAMLLVPFLRWDRCVILTDPPFLLGVAWLSKLLGRRRQLFWWTMDLYPEALVADGYIPQDGFVDRLLRGINNSCIKALSGVIALGPAQVERLRANTAWKETEAFYQIVPPWDDRPLRCDPAAVTAIRERFGWQQRRVLLYAGNLGRGHSYGDVLEAAARADEAGSDWIFAFFCRGARRKALERDSAHLKNVVIDDYVAPEETAALLHAATVQLITMDNGWDGVVVPSKLYGVLQTGAPVLFIGPAQADTAREIGSHDLGVSLPNGCGGAAILQALTDLLKNSRPAMRLNSTGPRRIAEFVTRDERGEACGVKRTEHLTRSS